MEATVNMVSISPSVKSRSRSEICNACILNMPWRQAQIWHSAEQPSRMFPGPTGSHEGSDATWSGVSAIWDFECKWKEANTDLYASSNHSGRERPFARGSIILLVVPFEDAETKTGWVTRSEQSRIHLAPYTLHFKPRQSLLVSCCGDAYPSSRQREESSLRDKMLTVEAGEANLYNNEKKRKETSAFQG